MFFLFICPGLILLDVEEETLEGVAGTVTDQLVERELLAEAESTKLKETIVLNHK